MVTLKQRNSHKQIRIVGITRIPRLRNNELGLRIKATISRRNTSTEFVPRSTKSPLNKYALSAEGIPFYKYLT